MEPQNGQAATETLVRNMPESKQPLAGAVMDSLLSPRSGLTPEGAILMDGVRTVLALRTRYGQGERPLTDPSKYIDLRYYEVSDKEVGDFSKWLQAFPRLTMLQFKSTKITDAGLTHLKRLPRLRTLALENAKITDAGLAQLKDLLSLEALNLKGTQVTDAGAQALKQALPRVKVER